MIHTIKKIRGKRQLFVIKVDLKKAYNRLNWKFIQSNLKLIGMIDPLINLIMKCIISTTLNVIWNGYKTKYFNPIKGVLQGDLLSPYIFVICMDQLSHIISELLKPKNGFL